MNYALFDVDGVLLSEERCFDVSALTVWEWYKSPAYLGRLNESIDTNPPEETVRHLRTYYWDNDRLLAWLKQFGINSNWDMDHAHIVATMAMMTEEKRKAMPEAALPCDGVRVITDAVVCRWRDYFAISRRPEPQEVLEWLQSHIPADTDKDGVFTSLVQLAEERMGGQGWADLGGALWDMHVRLFQNWYLGDEATGKPGFLHRETPLADVPTLRAALEELKQAGVVIGIGTGRTLHEAKTPLTNLGLWTLFAKNHVGTKDDATMVETQLGYGRWDKPNPFTYQAAWWGNAPANYVSYATEPERWYRKEDTVYIIGDSVADILAAKEIDAISVATLTGLTGEAARDELKVAGADHIVADVLEAIAKVRELIG